MFLIPYYSENEMILDIKTMLYFLFDNIFYETQLQPLTP